MMRGPPKRPVPFQGDLRNLPEALAPLKEKPNWVCWKFVWKVDKKGVGSWTKPPYQPKNPTKHAKNNDFSTWGTLEQALAVFEAGKFDGIGFCLFGTNIAAFDIDKCRDPATGDIAPEATEVVERAASYTEMTPSGTGLRVVGFGSGDKVHRKQKVPGCAVEVESYRGAERYITVTGNPLPESWPHMADIDGVIDDVVAELDGCKDEPELEEGYVEDRDESAHSDELPDNLSDLIGNGVSLQDDLSAAFHGVVCQLGERGWSADQIEARITGKPIVPERFAKRLHKEIVRCLQKARTAQQNYGVALDDFYAFMPRHCYIFVPTREMWPGSSVDSRLPKVPLKKKNGAPVVNEEGKPKHSRPSVWLDKHRPVEQMTWAPGEPLTVKDRLIAEGGWFERPGATTFNLYRPPNVRQGNSANADRWIELAHRLYPGDADHIITYCAHRIQFPAIKINHGVILGGVPGIGKDTLLEPLKHGVGPWNFKEISPQDIMSSYNDFMQCVVLRISEAHDLGDINRYAFYDHMKTILATPPDVIRVNGKYIPQHYILNVAGVIYTTNNRFDAIYLPPNDRRTYVAWSELLQADFADGFWKGIWHWYETGGLEDVVAYLAEYDLSKFDPKAPPKKTDAFWQIVNAGAAPENSELADALDALGRKEGAQDSDGPCGPIVTTLTKVLGEVHDLGDLYEWLTDRKNRRVIPHRFEACGYRQVLNPDAKDGLWVISGRRQTIYGRMNVPPDELVKAARKLT